MVHRPPAEPTWRERLPAIGSGKFDEYSFELSPRDEAGARYLEAIKGQGINHVADAVAQSADHVQSFFAMLRLELAFYLACLNLHARLEQRRSRLCFPEPLAEVGRCSPRDSVYDVCLALVPAPARRR